MRKIIVKLYHVLLNNGATTSLSLSVDNVIVFGVFEAAETIAVVEEEYAVFEDNTHQKEPKPPIYYSLVDKKTLQSIIESEVAEDCFVPVDADLLCSWWVKLTSLSMLK